MKYWLIILVLIIQSETLFGQLPLKRDDFVGTTRKNWWQWHNDGPNTPVPDVRNGFVLFSLVDPDSTFLPYCDAALWDGYPGVGGPYMYCTVVLRAKALNLHKKGSRGWGLWYTEPVPYEQQQAWYMRSKDDSTLTDETWWRAETAKGINDATLHYVALDSLNPPIDDMEWHTYKIIRNPGFVDFQIDGQSVLYVTQDLPDLSMSFHIWVDNLVYEYIAPGQIVTHRREWVGKNEIVLDYVQILTSGTLDSSETPRGIKLLREIPREIGNGQSQYLWKQYQFTAQEGNIAVLATGRVEQYLDASNQAISDDDDIRFVVDGTDYGWETSTSFNADATGTQSKTLLLQQTVTAGTKTLNVYGDITPLLYDVTVLGAPNGGVIRDLVYNETAPGGTDYLWKEITFPCYTGEVAIYISASADEDPNPSRYGYQYSDFDDASDDDLRIELDGVDYGYKTAYSFWGNRLFGEPKSVLIVDTLTQGNHTLRLYANNTPTLYRVVIYGEYYDESLPVELAGFNVQLTRDANVLHWQTASEINTLGFNIYKAVAEEQKDVSELQFFKITPRLIPGAGNSNTTREYSFTDKFVENERYYWYRLEEVDYNGNKTELATRMVFRPDNLIRKFYLQQNYPNPFNQSTRIPVQVWEPGEGQFTIYSVNGQVLYRETVRFENPGKQYLDWDGTDLQGNALPSGIYYYQLRLQGEAQVKSLLLVR